MRGLLIGVGVVAVVLAAAWFALPGFSLSSQDIRPMLHTVKRGEFIHDITERGNVESASNVEIRCMVQSFGSGGTMILELIPEGTYVQPGDQLAKLDSSSLENQEVQQQIQCNSSEASVIQARNSYETAVISKKEYLEGTFVQSRQALESLKFVAEEDLRRAQQSLEYDTELEERGYISDLQIQADEFAVERNKKDLESADTAIMVLDKYTKDKTVKQLEADIKTSEARLKSEEHSYQLDLEKLALVQEQIKNCVIKAPEPGQVVYANETDRRSGGSEVIIEEGVTVRERQVIFKLPDPKRMQVKAMINEARVSMVAKGMRTLVRLDAFPDMELTGTVEKVNDYPAPTSMFSSSVKEYETTIKVDGSPEGLRPGLTAEVKIRVERLSDAIQVPMQAVFLHGGKNYAIIYGGPEPWDLREVTLGSTNDKFVVIDEGVKEGEQVVLGATAYREKVNLPPLPPGQMAQGQASSGKQPAAGDQEPAASPSDSQGTEAKKPAAAGGGAPGGAQAFTFSTLDQNGDGKLDANEIPERMRERLTVIDTNKDGSVDQGEFSAVMKMMGSRTGAKGKGGGPGGRQGGRAPGGGGPGGGGPGGGGPGGDRPGGFGPGGGGPGGGGPGGGGPGGDRPPRGEGPGPRPDGGAGPGPVGGGA